ncbi:hypothetical protein [Escherichia phage BF17]|nr:hypothetical protein [Escherichia phage BF17]
MYKDFYISKLKENEQIWINNLIPLPMTQYEFNMCTKIVLTSNDISNTYYFLLRVLYGTLK